MSLINDMLKDLEKRRSRDLETSESLSKNITWETRSNQKTFNWMMLFAVLALATLLGAISYLLWERTSLKSADSLGDKKVAIVSKKQNPNKEIVRKEVPKKVKKAIKVEAVEENNYSDEIAEPVNVEADAAIDDLPIIKVEKTNHPLNNKQLAEIAYQKGFKLLSQGRMHQGKQFLREALSLYIPHIKAREMLAGIHIKSGHFIDAAELLSEGVKVVPEYPLFAQLYARVLLEQNNPQLAIQILERGSSSASMNTEPDYFALLAATYQRVKNHDKAIDVYLKLVNLRPDAGIWWLGLAISLEKTDKNKEALDAYQRAQKSGSLNSGLIKFTNNRVSALREIGFPEK
jgi:tetratricopeptide (TPR) repeat protein